MSSAFEFNPSGGKSEDEEKKPRAFPRPELSRERYNGEVEDELNLDFIETSEELPLKAREVEQMNVLIQKLYQLELGGGGRNSNKINEIRSKLRDMIIRDLVRLPRDIVTGQSVNSKKKEVPQYYESYISKAVLPGIDNRYQEYARDWFLRESNFRGVESEVFSIKHALGRHKEELSRAGVDEEKLADEEYLLSTIHIASNEELDANDKVDYIAFRQIPKREGEYRYVLELVQVKSSLESPQEAEDILQAHTQVAGQLKQAPEPYKFEAQEGFEEYIEEIVSDVLDSLAFSEEIPNPQKSNAHTCLEPLFQKHIPGIWNVESVEDVHSLDITEETIRDGLMKELRALLTMKRWLKNNSVAQDRLRDKIKEETEELKQDDFANINDQNENNYRKSLERGLNELFNSLSEEDLLTRKDYEIISRTEVRNRTKSNAERIGVDDQVFSVYSLSRTGAKEFILGKLTESYE